MNNCSKLKTVLNTGNVCMKCLQSIAVAAGILTAGSYVAPRSLSEYQVLPISLALIFAFIIIWKLTYYSLQKAANFKSKIVILGTSKEAKKIAEDLQIYHPLGYEFKGFIHDKYDTDFCVC